VTTLRILFSDVPRPGRADAWALFADDGRVVREGRDSPEAWPRADRVEAVVAAERARLVVLTLPPMSADRLPAAVEYALEDQVATGASSRVAIGPARTDGRVVAAIADRALVDGIEAAASFARIVPESALCDLDETWTWRASAAGPGFISTPQGAFAATLERDEVPAELVAALAQARRIGAVPAAVHTAFDLDPIARERLRDATGVDFVASPAWRWTQATAAQLAAAPDWHAPARASPSHERAAGAAWLRPALALAAAALVMHVGATLVHWASLHVQAWRVQRDIVALAQASGVADTSSVASAVAGLVRRHAESRHRAGQPAPGDALPLLATAAPALAGLPANALRSGTYSDGAWTLELGKLDNEPLARVDRALNERGLSVLHAPSAAGVRMRITAKP
jgi:hypothetical protein